MVITESIFIEVGLKVLGADSVVDSRYATLRQTPEALNAVSVGIPIDVDLRTMLDSLKLLVQLQREHDALSPTDTSIQQALDSLMSDLQQHSKLSEEAVRYLENLKARDKDARCMFCGNKLSDGTIGGG